MQGGADEEISKNAGLGMPRSEGHEKTWFMRKGAHCVSALWCVDLLEADSFVNGGMFGMCDSLAVLCLVAVRKGRVL